jgi:hypothetical protein
MNDPRDFKVLRPKQGDPHGKVQWRPLRRGVADMYRRAQVGQASNERYLDALAATDTSTPLGELIRDICKPTTYRDKRVRALRPWADPDLALLRVVNRGEFSVNGASAIAICSPCYSITLQSAPTKSDGAPPAYPVY